MGLRLLQNPSKHACLATVVLFFAPKVVPDKTDGGQTFIFEGTKGLPQSVISRSGNKAPANASVADEVLVFDETETFYVINLTELQSRIGNTKWSARVAAYHRVMADSSRTDAYKRVNAQRFFLDIIRTYRYYPPRANNEDLQINITRELAQKHIICRGREASTLGAKPSIYTALISGHMIEVSCILTTSFFQTELGNINPFSVTDALDNSGLAIGPRQIDLGQLSVAARRLQSFLLSGESLEERSLLSHFFVPIERLTPTGYKRLYGEVIPRLNSKLNDKATRDFIISDFVKEITSLLNVDKQLDDISPHDANEHNAFRAVVIDFNNKWPGEIRAVIKRVPRQTYVTACDSAIAWVSAFQGLKPPAGDVKDARRRADIVMRSYYWESSQPRDQCKNLSQ
jgi:hypothetical protein